MIVLEDIAGATWVVGPELLRGRSSVDVVAMLRLQLEAVRLALHLSIPAYPRRA